MKPAVAHTDRVVAELFANDVMLLLAALRTYRVQRSSDTIPDLTLDHRLRQLISELEQADAAMWNQKARALGLRVEGDMPCEGGAF